MLLLVIFEKIFGAIFNQQKKTHVLIGLSNNYDFIVFQYLPIV